MNFAIFITLLLVAGFSFAGSRLDWPEMVNSLATYLLHLLCKAVLLTLITCIWAATGYLIAISTWDKRDNTLPIPATPAEPPMPTEEQQREAAERKFSEEWSQWFGRREEEEKWEQEAVGRERLLKSLRETSQEMEELAQLRGRLRVDPATEGVLLGAEVEKL
ncbi:hypothetical protein B0A50_04231 [Salinomyces thailandicus]|uniref:Endoplasmic reticulum transmembrane protein n=1 Tax=Salinomyces thailandicus TaxID=706561 RepID=A0A4U0TYC9_9PEZI|nr:hypothetical protein B0A50_04231 [Salinomyces thailandica]